MIALIIFAIMSTAVMANNPYQRVARVVSDPRVAAIHQAQQYAAIEAHPQIRGQVIAVPQHAGVEVYQTHGDQPERYGFQNGPVSFQYSFLKAKDLINEAAVAQHAGQFAIAPPQYAGVERIAAQPQVYAAQQRQRVVVRGDVDDLIAN